MYIYINDSQRYNDNKYLNKMHNIKKVYQEL